MLPGSDAGLPEPLRPPDDDCEPVCDGRPEGIEELEPLRPEGDGNPAELPPERPELPPDEPLEPPDEPPLGGDEVGEGIEDDDCWPAHPPMRKADTVPTAVTWAATASRRFHEE